jgi:hypothetical protein
MIKISVTNYNHLKIKFMSTGKVVKGILAGAVAGALLGILLAPDSGDKTRKKISKKVLILPMH